MSSRLKMSFEERFWSKVDKTETCWNWTAGKKDDGYGQFWAPGTNRLAHRIAYELTTSPVPEGLELDHTCHNRACVNPSHLRVVTHKTNIENRNGAQSNSKSGVRGVCWDKNAKKWHARVFHHRKAVYVGHFSDLEEARIAVETARSEVYNTNKNRTEA